MSNNALKYTKGDRLKIVKEHVDEGVSLHDLAKKYNYSTSTIKYLVKLYRKYGEKAFAEKEIRTYTREEKLKAIKRHNDGESFASISLDMCIGDRSLVRDWCVKYQKEGEEAIKDTHSREAYKRHDDKVLEKEYKKLLEDLERTKAENEYLKKSFPLILERSKQSKKK